MVSYVPQVGLIGIGAAKLDASAPNGGYLYVISDETTSQELLIRYFITYLLFVSIMILFIRMILGRRIKLKLVSPLDEIIKAAEGFSLERNNDVLSKEHFTALDITTGNELEDLTQILGTMEQDLGEYVERIKTISAEQERKLTELKMGAKIQRAALPNTFPAFPDRCEFDLYAAMKPAKEVGGDFYDFYLVDDDHLCLTIADVSDKGVPAALFMMTSKTTLFNNIMMGKSPAQALTDTNEAICKNTEMRMFVSIWVGILEISTGKLTASNGGHEYPVLQGANGRWALYKDRHSLVVGGRPKTVYRDYVISLKPGSKIFVYTDGVPEATTSTGEMFEMDRMVKVLNEERKANPEEVVKNMDKAVKKFIGDAEQYDDVTMLCIEYKGCATRAKTSETKE